MTSWYLWVPLFLLLGAPTVLLVLDRARGYPAHRFVRTQGVPALIAFAVIALSAAWAGDPVVDLLVWGAVGGVFGTIALDAVRLLGVKFHAFPMDMPRMFGLMILGLAPAFQGNLMAAMARRLAAEPPERRRDALRERMAFLAQLAPWRRKIMLGGMMRGIAGLPEDLRRDLQVQQVEVLASLPEASRTALMRTMDELTMSNPEYVPPTFLEAISAKGERLGGQRPIPMRVFNEAADSVFQPTLREHGVRPARVLSAGYAYHLANGITYGMAYTMLFGSGSWTLALLWGVFVWLVMMVTMPRMMPVIRFPRWFPAVPLLAHLAMAIPIGFFALRSLGPEATGTSLIAGLGLEGLLKGLGLL